jgi:hypothetical protein
MKGLRKLEPDRTGADHHEMLRPLGELEHRLVGEVGRRREPGNRRQRRRRPGRDHEAARPDLDPRADGYGLSIPETCGAFDHPHAEAGEPFLGIVRLDRGDDVVHVLVDLAEIDPAGCAGE